MKEVTITQGDMGETVVTVKWDGEVLDRVTLTPVMMAALKDHLAD
jgi:hypothetical protein